MRGLQHSHGNLVHFRYRRDSSIDPMVTDR
jgi:hypothetical protein